MTSGGLAACRIIVQVIGIVILVISIGFLCGAILTTAWQTVYDPGTGEIHQHGLWLDYNLAREHTASSTNGLQWTFKYKFGDAVIGDEVHRAQDYQINCLILQCVGILLAIFGLFISYCACCSIAAGILWSILNFIATLICAVGLIIFYIKCMDPGQRYVNTDRKLEQIIGYSFYYGVIGMVGFAITTVFSISSVVLLFLTGRTTISPTKSYPKIHPRQNTAV